MAERTDSGRLFQREGVQELKAEYRYGFLEGQFRLSETSYMQFDTDWMCLDCIYVNLVSSPVLSQEPRKGS